MTTTQVQSLLGYIVEMRTRAGGDPGAGSLSTREFARAMSAIIDGVRLSSLLRQDEVNRRECSTLSRHMTPAQRAAVSAHWSAKLRAKVEAKRKADLERERTRVVVDLGDW